MGGRQEWDVRPECSAGLRAGPAKAGGETSHGADEEQCGHLLQECPPQDLLLLLLLQQVQEPAPAEGQAYGGARPKEDGKHLLQHFHGCPLTPFFVPNLPLSSSLS